nr:protein BIG GRAIN 1-like A [Tanacetum cinerariifolium]
MYNWDKSHKKDKPRKNRQTPYFSLTLLDEIYRSIDGSDEKFGKFKVRKPKVAKKPIRGKLVEDEEIASFHRACLVEKWMEMKANEKEVVACHRSSTLPEFGRKGVLDNEHLFFSFGSSSSDSSFGWHFEAEVVKPKPSCFGPIKRHKHVKTSVSLCSAMKKQNEFLVLVV